ncbi:MAG: 5'-nucleotidase C-terminal domain-containing protein [Armatimonadota bacterium]
MLRQTAVVGLLLMVSAPALADAVFDNTAVLSSEGCGRAETSLGNMVADALRQASKADAALVHAEILREITLPVGPVREAELRRAVLVPQDGIVVLRLSGAQLRQALERSVRIYPARNQGFLQVSGLTVVFNPSNPEGSRVVDLKVNGVPVSEGRLYAVAMPALLAGGAQGYHRVWEKAPRIEGQRLGTIAEVLIEFAKSKGKLSFKVEGRIKTSSG